ncbi:MAG: hypothetical protein ACE361_09870 [Aureliella sp.]
MQASKERNSDWLPAQLSASSTGRHSGRIHLISFPAARLEEPDRRKIRNIGSIHSRVTRLAMLFVIALFCASGCSRLRLPAIDPNGSRIFLPLPQTTNLAIPPLRSTDGQPGIIPTPAYTQPATPPPCLDASNGGVCNLFGDKHRLVSKLQRHFDRPGKLGEIQLTPMRVVAPVGGEVVLLAGICGEQGRLVKRQPLEWMLSPDSVGTFIQVGDDKPGKLSSFFLHDPKIEKLDVDFARGRTSAKRTIITRGTPNCNDDIELREGQTWLSVSSPSEGVSRITALAPHSEIWDHRRLTATIYWVDAQWEFPRPAIERVGQPIELLTRVTKAENLVPAEGWIVQYTIVDPSIAAFSSDTPAVPGAEANVAAIRVNADGQAPVRIVALPDARGTTPVIIEVIRPEDPNDNLPRLTLARGQTTVTFSAPGLNLEAFGPTESGVGEQLTYTAVVGNPGDLPAGNVVVQMQKPVGTKLVAAVPQPSTETNQYLEWDQGVLDANQQLNLAVTLEPLQTGTFSVLWRANGVGFPTRERRSTTQVVQPSVEVRFAPAGGVAEAEVGELVDYEIEITNSGRQSLTGLVLKLESAEGLLERFTEDNLVEQEIPMLQPNETRRIPVAFRVQQTGQLGVQLRVLSGETVLAERVASIQGVEPAPKVPSVRVTIDTPSRVIVGTTQRAVFNVRNTGETSLTGLEVEIAYDPSLAPRQVNKANENRVRLDPNRRVLTWSPPDLMARSPGGGDPTLQLTVDFASVAEATNGQLACRVTSAERVQDEDTVAFEAIARSNSVLPPGRPTLPPETNGSSVLPSRPNDVLPDENDGTMTNQLRVSLDDFGDPTIVGRELRYSLVVTNDRAVEDRNVRVLLRIPEGVELIDVSLDGNTVGRQYLEDGSVALDNIQFIRPREQVVFFLVIRPTVPERITIRAQTYSDGQEEPFNTSEDTTVNVR